MSTSPKRAATRRSALVVERPARDHAPGGVVDEGHLGRSVDEDELATRVQRHAAEREEGPVRSSTRVESSRTRRAGAGSRAGARCRAARRATRKRGRHTVARREHVEPFDHAERADDDGAERERAGHERDVERTAPRGAPLADLIGAGARQRSLEMQARELLGARPRFARGAIDEAHRAQGAVPEIGFGRDDGASRRSSADVSTRAAREPRATRAAPKTPIRAPRRAMRAAGVPSRARWASAKIANTATANAARRAGPSTRRARGQRGAADERGRRSDLSAEALGMARHRSSLSARAMLRCHGQAEERRPAVPRSAQRGALVVDGGMGTQLYERGVLFSVNYEELNLSRPELVRKVHEDYVRAGAQRHRDEHVRRERVRLERHGLEGEVREINLAAVKLARGGGGGQGLRRRRDRADGLVFEGVRGRSRRACAPLSRRRPRRSPRAASISSSSRRCASPQEIRSRSTRCAKRSGASCPSSLRSRSTKSSHGRRHLDRRHGRDA